MFSNENGMTMPVMPMGYGNGGWGGSFGNGFEAIIWLVVIAAIFGGGFGGFGWGNGGGNAALTRGELCQDMNFNDLQSGVRTLQQSVSDGFANQNQYFTDRVDVLANQIATGFDAINLSIVRDGYETRNAAQQNMIANMQNTYALQGAIKDGFCDVRSGFAQVAYQQATDACAITTAIATAVRDITDNANANTRSLYDFLVNDKISDLQQENQTLRLEKSQEKQNNYLLSELRPCPRPAYITCNPYASVYGNGNACGCGCGM
jgi:hypothetical protein